MLLLLHEMTLLFGLETVDCSTRIEAISILHYVVQWLSLPLTPSLRSWHVWIHNIDIFSGPQMLIAAAFGRPIRIDTLLLNCFRCINWFHITLFSSRWSTRLPRRIQHWTDFPLSFGEWGWEDNKRHMLPDDITCEDASETVPNLIDFDFNTKTIE